MADSLTPFEPLGLGPQAGDFRAVLAAIEGRRQSEIIAILADEVVKRGEPGTYEEAALQFALLVLRDYVAAGNYPLVRSGRCALAQFTGGEGVSERGKLQALYRSARARALSEEGKGRSLAAFKAVAAANRSSVSAVIDCLERDAPAIGLIVAGKADRVLWNAIRATWTMPPDRSAPGRQVSFLASSDEYPQVPLAIFQFRNVVPEIRARDLWLGISSDGLDAGYMARVAREPDMAHRLRSTLDVVDGLLSQVYREKLEQPLDACDDKRLGDLARQHRDAFNDARRRGEDGAKEHLHLSKRAATAAELVRGARSLRLLIEAEHPVDLYRAEEGIRRGVDSALRKIWHYHMGFVAIELSICGAAPPFGPMRAGKLAAALAGSREAIEAWGTDRPLGEIAEMVYRPEVRHVVPNPGPLVVFTSGLYPEHSAQYARATSGKSRWVKIGETAGFGSSHLSADAVAAADRLNELADGYVHISRSFGEGAGARFRAVGRAIDRLALPDVRRHETSRPLYALPLVDDVLGVLAGWAPRPVPASLPTATELGEGWWRRWVAPRREELAAMARRQADLSGALAALEREVRRLS